MFSFVENLEANPVVLIMVGCLVFIVLLLITLIVLKSIQLKRSKFWNQWNCDLLQKIPEQITNMEAENNQLIRNDIASIGKNVENSIVKINKALSEIVSVITTMCKDLERNKNINQYITQNCQTWIQSSVALAIQPEIQQIVKELDAFMQKEEASQKKSIEIMQNIPYGLQNGFTNSIQPELEKISSNISVFSQTVGETQRDSLKEIVNCFIAELNKKVEESASQYESRIAQSAVQFNESLASINSTVSVTLTDALSGFDSELQATLTELLETMKKLRAATNNIPKVIDSSFSEMQRSFDEMEEEMQKTISTFRDMRQKIDAQKSTLGPVQPTMVRNEELPQQKSDTEPVRKRGFASMFSTTKNETTSTPVAKPYEGITSKPNNSSDSPMNFSNY